MLSFAVSPSGSEPTESLRHVAMREISESFARRVRILAGSRLDVYSLRVTIVYDVGARLLKS